MNLGTCVTNAFGNFTMIGGIFGGLTAYTLVLGGFVCVWAYLLLIPIVVIWILICDNMGDYYRNQFTDAIEEVFNELDEDDDDEFEDNQAC